MDNLALNNPYLTILLIGLVAASVIDMITKKIPNLLILILIISGIFSQSYIHGTDGTLASLAGTGVGLILLFPLYCLGGLGAGDVKLMSAAGSFLNAPTALLAVVMSVNTAAVIGIFLLIVHGGLRPYLRRYLTMAKTCLATGSLIYIPPATNEAANRKFPCAIAIALGCTTALFFDSIISLL